MRIKHILITAVLATAILCFGPSANAQTTDTQALIAQLQAQIAQLLAQIQALQAQQGATPTWCHTFNTNLRFGDTGSEVSELQTALGKQSIIIEDYSAAEDGAFTEGTASAIVEFQEKYAEDILAPLKLKHGTGNFGSTTRKKMNALYGCRITPTPICSNLYWFDNTSSGQCQTQKQFCGAYMYYGLRTFDNQQDCLNAFNIARGSCIPNWQCGWGQCVNGYQSQVAIDSNNCGVATGNNIVCTALARQCNTTQPSFYNTCNAQNQCVAVAGTGNNECSTNSDCVCVPNWQCTAWTTCANSQQTRTCNDSNNCGTTINKPSETQSCSITPAPSITVTSPNGGEAWTTGSTRDITWQSYNLSGQQVSVSLIDPITNETKYDIASSASASSGFYDWTIPAAVAPGNYKINVFFTTGVSDSSDNVFSIIAPSTMPSIMVVSPNGGEKWEIGEIPKITVRWQTTNISSSQKLDVIKIKAYPSNKEYDLAYNILNDGYEVISIPYFVPAGAYTLEIKTYVNNVLVSDAGDSYFKTYFKTFYPYRSFITVLSPKGGETYTAGQTMNITWNSQSIDSLSDKLYITYSSVKQYRKPIATVSIFSNSYSWTIPNDLPGGDQNFSVSITCLDCAGAPNNMILGSSPYFQIAASTSLIDKENALASISSAISKVIQSIQEMLKK